MPPFIPYMITTNVISSPGISGPYLCASVQNGQIIDVYIDIDNAQTECDVFESSRYEEKIANNWKLAIVDIVTGEVKVNRNINGNHCQIDATGWKSGIYAINGIVNGKSASTKVFIK